MALPIRLLTTCVTCSRSATSDGTSGATFTLSDRPFFATSGSFSADTCATTAAMWNSLGDTVSWFAAPRA